MAAGRHHHSASIGILHGDRVDSILVATGVVDTNFDYSTS